MRVLAEMKEKRKKWKGIIVQESFGRGHCLSIVWNLRFFQIWRLFLVLITFSYARPIFALFFANRKKMTFRVEQKGFQWIARRFADEPKHRDHCQSSEQKKKF